MRSRMETAAARCRRFWRRMQPQPRMTLLLTWGSFSNPTDLTTAQPSVGLDALYGVLGLVLGVNAWNERTALAAAREARSKGLQEQGQQQQQEHQQQRSHKQPPGRPSGDEKQSSLSE